MHILLAINKILVEPAIKDYIGGESLRFLSRKYGFTTKNAKDMVTEAGLVVRNDMRKVYDQVNQDTILSAISDYKNGDGLRTVTKRYKIGARVFYRHLETHGVPARSVQANRYPYLNAENMEKVKVKFAEGYSMTEIARICDLCRSSVKTLLRHLGIRRRNKDEVSSITKWNKMGTKDIPGKFITSWRASAKTRGHEWEMSPEYLQTIFESQKGLCYYTGIKLATNVKKEDDKQRVNPYRMSLDRKDSSKGYIVGNVVLCSTFANCAKNDLPLEAFIDLLKKAGDFQNSKILLGT